MMLNCSTITLQAETDKCRQACINSNENVFVKYFINYAHLIKTSLMFHINVNISCNVYSLC